MRSRKYQDIGTAEEIEAMYGEEDIPGKEEVPKPEYIISDDKEESVGFWLKEWIKEVVFAILVAIIVLQFIKPTVVKQKSMEPNFYTNDYLLVSKQAYRLFKNEPKIGDVIVFSTDMKTENGDDKLLIKRVIGVEGDTVSITGGKVYINGEIIDDSYTMDQYTEGEIGETVVPEGKLFCLGDNRGVSIDSRSSDVGFVDEKDVIGRVIFRLLPIKSLGRIENPYS